MRQAPVSVVIPTFNRQDTIEDAVDSALAQTLRPAQVIVVDDGSSDCTADRLKRYRGRITFHRQPNGGISNARNNGVRLASEPYIALLDSDDVWHPRKLELQMRALERNPELGMLGTSEFVWPTERFPEVPDEVAFHVFSIGWDALVLRTSLLTSGIIIRREVFDRVGGFDPAMVRCEDRDLFLRVAEVAGVGILAAPLLGYRDTPGSASKHAAACELSMRQILRRFDEARRWQGRWLLRFKAYSLMHQTCCDAQASAGNHFGAVVRAIKAIVYYPLPYRPDEVRLRFDRPRRLAVNLLRLMRLRNRDPGAAAKLAPASDALWALRRATEGLS